MVDQDRLHPDTEDLIRRVRHLEEQVKKLVAGEVRQYDLQARLDTQLKIQAELLRLSQRLQHCRDEQEVGSRVTEALVEDFDYAHALFAICDPTSGRCATISRYGCQDDLPCTGSNEPASELFQATVWPRANESERVHLGRSTCGPMADRSGSSQAQSAEDLGASPAARRVDRAGADDTSSQPANHRNYGRRHYTREETVIQTDCAEPLLGMDERAMIPCVSTKGELLGCMVFGNDKARFPYHRRVNSADRPWWETVRAMVSTALENALLYKRLDAERETLKRARDRMAELNERLERIVEKRTKDLRESEARYRELYREAERTGNLYRTMLDASPDPIVVYDIQGSPSYINPAFTYVFGWTLEELKGNRIDFVPRNNRPENHEMISMVMSGQSFTGRETKRLTKDGNLVEVSVSGAIYLDEKGLPAGSIILLRDITDRKRLEQEFVKVIKLESTGVLAGGIAHDFNNILSGVLMNAQLAKKHLAESQAVEKYLTGIEEAARRATGLTQQLLTFAKGGAPVLKTASISELIQDSARFVLPGAKAKCEFHLAEDLRPVEVDEGQMSQVIGNLIINAGQAMPEGGIITITGENIAVDEDAVHSELTLTKGHYVRISIEDRGLGIAEQDLPQIFDPYFTTKQGGSGLGLTTTYSIVRQHGGSIAVESEIGRGTVFHVYLPVSHKRKITERGDFTPMKPLARGGKILIMDDEETLRELLAELLCGYGFQVGLAENGEEAVVRYKDAEENGQPYDAVIMDLTIPGGMGGREAIRRLLEIDPKVKAIVSSGYSNDPIMARYREYGFRGVAVKPHKIEDLVAELLRVLSDEPTGRST
ncbi:MAG: ATP-binding protein [Thermodesulfobacteriota bacterium]